MGSYKWGYKSPKMGITIVTLLITPLITSYEPPSKPKPLEGSPNRLFCLPGKCLELRFYRVWDTVDNINPALPIHKEYIP